MSTIRKLIDERYKEIVVIIVLAAVFILLVMAALSMGKATAYMVNVDITIRDIDAVHAVVFVDGWYVFNAAVDGGMVLFEGRIPFDVNVTDHIMSMTFIHADGSVTTNAVTIDVSAHTSSVAPLVIDISVNEG